MMKIHDLAILETAVMTRHLQGGIGIFISDEVLGDGMSQVSYQTVYDFSDGMVSVSLFSQILSGPGTAASTSSSNIVSLAL